MHVKPLQPLRRALPLRERVHDRLRQAILSGDMPPGMPVIEADLADRLGASRTPIREALRRLEAEGLIEPRGLRGSVVRAMPAREVDCIFEIREALESLAARRAARTITDAELRKLAAHVAAMETAQDDPREMERHDTAFHDIILANAEGERLKRMLSDLRGELITFRVLSLADDTRRRETVVEHRAMLAALHAHDEAAAAALTAQHIAHARAAVLRLSTDVANAASAASAASA